MQGTDCPSSIIAALDAVLESGEEYDAVLLLRGGGSKLDLSCFDDYDLAASVAQYPLPVLTAIGHDQDFHVCDMTAYEYVKTPTALADFILSFYEDEDARLSSFQTRMKLAFAGRISLMESVIDRLSARIRGGFAMKIASGESSVSLLEARINAADPRRILERGYALALDSRGVVMKSAGGRSVGDRVSLMFADGTLDCVVEDCRA
jgi:exodeoxyribonuclease VII large subunit